MKKDEIKIERIKVGLIINQFNSIERIKDTIIGGNIN